VRQHWRRRIHRNRSWIETGEEEEEEGGEREEG
jgi:hypothetical protein